MIDYEDAKEVYFNKLAETKGRGFGRIEAATLAMCEYVHSRAMQECDALVKENAELKEQLKNCKADLLAHLATVFSMEDDPIGRVEANVKNWLWRLAEAERKANE